ncbi:MAG: hypothetical protein CMM44_03900 [Rhodospirillaceae bacterium]|nr:hypothetical protein [Rhodospirillaceae bacterium]
MAYTNEDIAKKAEDGFKGFCTVTIYSTIGIIVVLLLMAIFLL